VQNNPVNFVDPSGLSPVEDFLFSKAIQYPVGKVIDPTLKNNFGNSDLENSGRRIISASIKGGVSGAVLGGATGTVVSVGVGTVPGAIIGGGFGFMSGLAIQAVIEGLDYGNYMEQLPQNIILSLKNDAELRRKLQSSQNLTMRCHYGVANAK
jgi:hypothetical protein